MECTYQFLNMHEAELYSNLHCVIWVEYGSGSGVVITEQIFQQSLFIRLPRCWHCNISVKHRTIQQIAVLSLNTIEIHDSHIYSKHLGECHWALANIVHYDILSSALIVYFRKTDLSLVLSLFLNWKRYCKPLCIISNNNHTIILCQSYTWQQS